MTYFFRVRELGRSAPRTILTQFLKPCVFIACLLPFLRLVWGGVFDHLGANPTEFITRSTGTWALVMLCLTLSITPLRQLTSTPRLAQLRRMLGLYTFFYAASHLLTFIWFDHFFDFDEIIKDTLKRPFIFVGMSAFLLLIPLALTSTNAMIKRLGAQRWKLLHRLVYVIAPLAIVHFVWMRSGKQLFLQPAIYGSVLALLMIFRVYKKYQIRSSSINKNKK